MPVFVISSTGPQEDLELIVETNGVKCTPEIANKIAKSKKPFVSISLDGSSAALQDRNLQNSDTTEKTTLSLLTTKK